MVQDLIEIISDEEFYDAIALVFIHLPSDIRKIVHRNLIKKLKPGGWIVIEAFSKKQFGRKTGGPPDIEMLYDEYILREDFNDLHIVKLFELTEVFDEGPFHQGESALIRMIAKKDV